VPRMPSLISVNGINLEAAELVADEDTAVGI